MMPFVATRSLARADMSATVRCHSARLCAALAVAAATLLVGAPAQAQVVALVNGEPITQVDIAHRTRMLQLSNQKAPARQEVLDELIDDKLKVIISKRYLAEVPKREIDSAFANIARRSGMSVQQFTQALQNGGISAEALRSRIHADFVWNQIIRGKFQASLQIGEKDVALALQSRNKKDEPTAAFDYRLRPILFLVPRGAAPAAFEARKRDAEALRGRFQNCDEGIRFAMALPDVAVRDAISRASSDLPGPQREVLNNTQPGRLTPPDITPQGVEVFAVCSKIPAVGGESPAKREVRDEMYQQKFNALSKKYLKELRAGAMIEYRSAN